MSTINNALSKLAEQQSAQSEQDAALNQASPTLVRATVSPVKSSRFVWAVGGFTLSLGLGAWAVTSAPDPIQTSVSTQSTVVAQSSNQAPVVSAPSNTSKVVEPAHTTIYEAPKVAAAPQTAPVRVASTSAPAKPATHATSINATSVHATTSHAPAAHRSVASNSNASTQTKAPTQTKAIKQTTAAPVLLASNNTAAKTSVEDSGSSSMQVQQVELSHRQMADKALDRAKKAIDANDFSTASAELQTALRYVPEDENTRRKLAALYYGNRQVRKSAEVLEEGIKLNKNSNALRMSLASILVKEKQPEAALSALGYIPDDVSDKYLAMRAALAQQLKNNDWAKQSYQMLTQRDPENGRWWLGLGIQQERSAELSSAKESYTKALTMVGLSSQSQAFIRDRLAVLTSLEQGAN